MKNQILHIIATSKTNKHSYNISKIPELKSWILDQTKNFPEDVSFLEKIYCVLHDLTPFCSNGNRKKFSNNLNVGYMNCGRATQCNCTKAILSEKISSAKQSMSDEEIKLANERRKQTIFKMHGVEYNSQIPLVKKKKERTYLEKYGVNTNLLSEETKLKIKNTSLKKYGVENPASSETIRKKIEETNLKKYGNICSAQSKEIRKTIYKNHNDKFGVKLFHKKRFTEEQLKLLTDRDLLEKEITEFGINQTSKKYDIHRDRLVFRLDAWGITYDKSFTSIEEFVKILLDELSIEYEFRSRKIIPPYELDFIIPSLKIAIEVCGLYWHSEKFVDKNYHKMKLDKCNEAGYRLITIFSDEIEFKPNIVKSRLKHILEKENRTIFARKCSIVEISPKESKDFLETYHIQGNAASNVRLGAYYNNTLVSVMTFSTNRKFTGDKSSYFELVRFATFGNVVGIAGKFLKYFIQNYSPDKIISYADRRWSEGNLYEKLGFNLTKKSNPNYWYSKNMIEREHRYKYRKSELVKQGFSAEKTETEIMNEQKILRIWDCGTLRYEWINNTK